MTAGSRDLGFNHNATGAKKSRCGASIVSDWKNFAVSLHDQIADPNGAHSGANTAVKSNCGIVTRNRSTKVSWNASEWGIFGAQNSKGKYTRSDATTSANKSKTCPAACATSLTTCSSESFSRVDEPVADLSFVTKL